MGHIRVFLDACLQSQRCPSFHASTIPRRSHQQQSSRVSAAAAKARARRSQLRPICKKTHARWLSFHSATKMSHSCCRFQINGWTFFWNPKSKRTGRLLPLGSFARGPSWYLFKACMVSGSRKARNAPVLTLKLDTKPDDVYLTNYLLWLHYKLE